jgi:glycosyltransferase involved in cell wall biosynthesis
MSSLDLGVIGNCAVAALIDRDARVVWYCLPRFDGDPVFHALLGAPKEAPDDGVFAIELEDHVHSEQHYIENTAVLVTELHGRQGSLRIKDFAPRFVWRDRLYYPQAMVRRLTPISGSPRIKIRLRPRFDYGSVSPTRTYGSHHIRYVGPQTTMRLTTDAPIDFIRDETFFNLSAPLDLFLGPDETLQLSVKETSDRLEERTLSYWRNWTHRLATPFEWQDAVIRAAITLKLCTYEPTGAIVAALTTSIPESPGTQRNWDYRFCWLRDAYFVVRALKQGRNFLVGYVGVMGEQEGIDLLLESVRHIVYGLGRTDIHFTLAGSGSSLESLKQLSRALKVEDYVTFLGRVPDELLFALLSTADVCVNPDRVNPMNDLSTMNKIMEYMAMSKPIVQFDVTEGRFSAQRASLYAAKNDPIDFAERILELLADENLRDEMGRFGRDRVVRELSWQQQIPALISAYQTAQPQQNGKAQEIVAEAES